MADIEVGGVYYRCNPLSTQLQWHVYRRLAGVFQVFAPLIGMAELIRGADGELRPDLSGIPMVAAVAALARGLAELSDADTDFIKDACLDSVRWAQGDRLMPVRAPGGVMLQSHADRFDMQLRLVWEVMRSSFENFSPEIAFPFLITNSLNGVDQTVPTEAPAVINP